MIRVITGDLLESQEKYIAHQCNCISKFASGLALSIFGKYPYSNVYKDRMTSLDQMGEIKICGNGENERYIINMFSQFYPGPNKDVGNYDTISDRENSFWKCLLKISEIPKLESIAFPYLIGCGLAGGNWSNYGTMLKDFSNLDSVKNVNVFIYKKVN